jgi:hypothetical protein
VTVGVAVLVLLAIGRVSVLVIPALGDALVRGVMTRTPTPS